MRQVVGQQLVFVGPAPGGEVANAPADDVAGELDHVGGAGEVGGWQVECFGHRFEANEVS